MDVFTKKKRSKVMSRIRGRDTKPELLLRKAIWNRKTPYRLHYRIAGRPDIAFPSRRIAVFVDGCFWHKCPVCYRQPSTNKPFWKNKLAMNVKRDRTQEKQLKAQGWIVLRFWEHEVEKDAKWCAKKISTLIKRRRRAI